MAGMLPGVESARRRRFHGNGGWSDTSVYVSKRRSFTSTHDCNLTSPDSLLRSMVKQEPESDEKLGGAVREAKERLNERLRTQWKSDTKRSKRQDKVGVQVQEQRPMVLGDLQIQVFGVKSKGSSMRFSWGKLGRKLASDGDECAVCLDQFKAGQALVHLPCAHRFHSRCLVPWLENNAQCPCCRMAVST